MAAQIDLLCCLKLPPHQSYSLAWMFTRKAGHLILKLTSSITRQLPLLQIPFVFMIMFKNIFLAMKLPVAMKPVAAVIGLQEHYNSSVGKFLL